MARSVANVSGGAPDFLTIMLGAAVLLCAVMFGVLVGRHFAMPGVGQRARSTAGSATLNNAPAAAAANDAPAESPTAASAADRQSATETLQPSASHKSAESATAPGGLVISENGKEIFRQAPGQPRSGQLNSGKAGAGRSGLAQPGAPQPGLAQSRSGQNRSIQAESVRPTPGPFASAPTRAAAVAGPSFAPGNGQTPTALSGPATDPIVQRAASIQPLTDLELAPAEAEANLINRVEPEYPDDARQQNIQGEVVLEIHIAVDGAVDGVDVVSGPRQLVQASADAVRQWRFKPHLVNGQAVRAQTRVALSFRLPS
jgi:TonB family protein